MTLPRYMAIGRHWKRTPPLSVTVAAIAQALGMKRSESSGDAPQEVSSDAKAKNFSALMELAGSGGLGGEIPEWLKEARAAERTSMSASAPPSTT